MVLPETWQVRRKITAAGRILGAELGGRAKGVLGKAFEMP